MNAAYTEAYKKRREREEVFFTDDYFRCNRHTEEFNGYQLTINNYRTEPGCWDYTRGIVIDRNGNVVADIKRNYHSFPHLFIHHSNGNDYLLCGEDYQGYTIVNLTKGTKHVYFPENGFKGWGFCWASFEWYDEETNQLLIEGCYWGAPFEQVCYDLTNPEELPLPEKYRDYVDIDDDDEDEEDE